MQDGTVYHCPQLTQMAGSDVTANKNRARKAVERKLLRDSSAVLDVFRLYEDTETVQRDGAGCNPTGRPAALWSKANYSGHPPHSSAPAHTHTHRQYNCISHINCLRLTVQVAAGSNQFARPGYSQRNFTLSKWTSEHRLVKNVTESIRREKEKLDVAVKTLGQRLWASRKND